MPNLTFTDVEEDIRPGFYYVSVIDGPKYALLAGPYSTHREALDNVDRVKSEASVIDPFSCFYSFGTARLPEDYPNPPTGKLN